MLSESRAVASRIFLYTFALLSVYPAALLLSVGMDTAFGFGTFMDNFQYGSKMQLIERVVADWLHSAAWWLPIAVVVLICSRYVAVRACRLSFIVIGIVLIVLPLGTAFIPVMFASTLGMAMLIPASASLMWSSDD